MRHQLDIQTEYNKLDMEIQRLQIAYNIMAAKEDQLERQRLSYSNEYNRYGRNSY